MVSWINFNHANQLVTHSGTNSAWDGGARNAHRPTQFAPLYFIVLAQILIPG